MIQQRPNDFLEVFFEENYYYVIVLTKITMFGGNIIFSFHTDGLQKNPTILLNEKKPKGFNSCTDLLLAKRQGAIRRIKNLENVEQYWKTKIAKSPIGAIQWGDKVNGWRIYSVEDLKSPISEKQWMTKKYKMAMERETASFDITAKRIKESFTPDKSPWITWKISDDERKRRREIYRKNLT